MPKNTTCCWHIRCLNLCAERQTNGETNRERETAQTEKGRNVALDADSGAAFGWHFVGLQLDKHSTRLNSTRLRNFAGRKPPQTADDDVVNVFGLGQLFSPVAAAVDSKCHVCWSTKWLYTQADLSLGLVKVTSLVAASIKLAAEMQLVIIAVP